MKRKADQTAGADGRVATFATSLRALNRQFASWVAQQAADHGHEVWSDGVEDYLTHAQKLLDEYKDVLQPDSSTSAAPVPAAGGFSFGSTPAAGPGFRFADATPSSSGKEAAAVNGDASETSAKHVRFSFGGAAAGDGAAAATPAAAPAPAGFSFGTPGAATPAVGITTTKDAGATPGVSLKKAGAADASPSVSAGDKPASSPGLFAFSTTPATSGSPAPFSFGAAAGSGSKAGEQADKPAESAAFSFGAAAGAGSADKGSAGGAATDKPAASTLSLFGTPAAGDKGGSDKPALGFGAAASGGGGAGIFGTPIPAASSAASGGESSAAAGAESSAPAPSFFSFTSSAAAAGASSAPAGGLFGAPPAAGGWSFPAAGSAPGGGGEGADGAEEAAPAKYESEVKLDSEAYEVLFSSKSKLYAMAQDKTWDEKGVGMLTVRKSKQGDDKKPRVFFTTEGGKSIIAQPISASLKLNQPSNTKKRVVTTCLMQVVTPGEVKVNADGQTEAGETKTEWKMKNVMLAFGKEDSATQFIKVVDECKAALSS